MYDVDKSEFGAFVAQLRKDAGLTQKELADKLYVSNKAVSKWETGVSLPDTALLIPLSEILNVSVTELLMAKRISHDEPMETRQVESVVQAAIGFKAPKAWQEKSRFKYLYFISLLAGCSAWFAGLDTGSIAITYTILGAVFGAYFCFFASMRLPDFYDSNRIGIVQDGIFRMNMPGISFNNSNWPHIVKACRLWSCLVVLLYPWLAWLFEVLGYVGAGNFIMFLSFLCSLFGTIYGVGKKYE